jgi:hypothetical protein
MGIGGNLGTVKARRWFFLDERWLLCDELLEGTEETEMESHRGNGD